MNAKFPPQGPARLPDAAADADPVGQVSGPGDRACCCVAQAVVRVVMPPAAGRPHESELLLCGHHYRVSRAALAAAHARVEELRADDETPPTWFDDHGRSARVAVAVAAR